MSSGLRARSARVALLAVPLAAAWVCAPRLTLEQFDLPKQTGLLLLLATALAAGTGGPLTDLRRRHVPLVALLIAVIASAMTAPSTTAAWLGDRENLTGVLTWLVYGALYLAGSRLSPVGLRRFTGAVTFTAAGSAVYALLQQAGWDPFRGEYFRHVRAFAGNPDFLAQQMAMAVPLALGAGPPRGFGLRAGFAMLLLAVLALTGSRAGLAAGLVAASWWIWRQRGTALWPANRIRRLAGLAAFALVAAELLIAPEISLRARLAALASGQGLLASRGAVWQGAASVATVRPLTGWGPDQLGSVFLACAPPGWASREGLGETARNAHDEPLHLLVTAGVAGLGAWLWLLAATWRRWRARGAGPVDDGVAAAAGAYLLHNLFSFGSATTAPVFWFLLGSLNRTSRSSGSAIPRGHPAIAALIALALGSFAAVRLTADAYGYRGNEAERARHPQLAEAEFAAAARLAPWDAAYGTRRAWSLEQLGRTTEALSWYERAAGMKPLDGLALGHVGRLRFALASAAKDQAEQRAALAILVRAVELAGSQPSLYGPALNAAQTLGEVALRDQLLARLAVRDPAWYAKMMAGH